MARAKITFFYNLKTGEYEIRFDMEQETINISRHDKLHEELIKKFFKNNVLEIEKISDDSKGEPPSRSGIYEDEIQGKKLKT